MNSITGGLVIHHHINIHTLCNVVFVNHHLLCNDKVQCWTGEFSIVIGGSG